MNKLKLLLKYLTISFIAANIPWIGWGVIFGWPAILMVSLTLTALDFMISIFNKSEMFLFTLFIGFMANVVNCIGWNILCHNSLLDLGEVVIASPSIIIGALLVTIFHKSKDDCICPVHKN